MCKFDWPRVKSVSLGDAAFKRVRTSPPRCSVAEDRNGCHLAVYPRSTGEVYIMRLRRLRVIDARRWQQHAPKEARCGP